MDKRFGIISYETEWHDTRSSPPIYEREVLVSLETVERKKMSVELRKGPLGRTIRQTKRRVRGIGAI